MVEMRRTLLMLYSSDCEVQFSFPLNREIVRQSVRLSLQCSSIRHNLCSVARCTSLSWWKFIPDATDDLFNQMGEQLFCCSFRWAHVCKAAISTGALCFHRHWCSWYRHSLLCAEVVDCIVYIDNRCGRHCAASSFHEDTCFWTNCVTDKWQGHFRHRGLFNRLYCVVAVISWWRWGGRCWCYIQVTVTVLLTFGIHCFTFYSRYLSNVNGCSLSSVLIN